MANKRLALWKRMAADEGFITVEQQQEWRNKAIKAYKASSPKTPQEKLRKAKLGYALRFTHSKPKEEKYIEKPQKESLLKQYKRLQTQKEVVKELDVGFQNFMNGLENLPPELQVEFNTKLNSLIAKWGEEPVKRYLNAFGFLDEDSSLLHISPYKEIIARAYLYRLAAAIEIAAEGVISSDTAAEAEEIQSMIDTYVKRSSTKNKLNDSISDHLVEQESSLAVLDEFFDSDAEEF